MRRFVLAEQGRGPKNRTCLRLLTICTFEVCLCTLWLGGAGAESCRAGPSPPFIGTTECQTAAQRRCETNSHTTCPLDVRSWQGKLDAREMFSHGDRRTRSQEPRNKQASLTEHARDRRRYVPALFGEERRVQRRGNVLSLSHFLPTGRENFSSRGPRAPTQEPRIFCPGIPDLRLVLRSIAYGCGSTWYFGADFWFWDILILSFLTSASALLPRFSDPRGARAFGAIVSHGDQWRRPQNRAPFLYVLQILAQGIISYQLWTCVSGYFLNAAHTGRRLVSVPSKTDGSFDLLIVRCKSMTHSLPQTPMCDTCNFKWRSANISS